MNIVHLQNLGGIGGIAVLTRDIAMTSKQNNFFYFLYEGGEIAEQIKQYAPVCSAEIKRKDFKSAIKSFTAFCEKANADVIVEHTGSAIGLICAMRAQKKLGTKLIIYWHSNAADFEKDGVKGKIEVIIKRLAYKKCTYAAAISHSVKESYLDVYKYKTDKIKVVYNGINCTKFYSKSLESSNEPPFNIIYVGRVFKSKGIHVLIDAVSLLDDEIKKNLHIKIVGKDSGTYTKEMIEKVKQLSLDNIIEFTGARLDVPDLLAEADLFVHPAIWNEGFGITLAEAMAAYLPCLAFKRGAIPEIIDEGVNGFIVDKISRKDLAKTIADIYNMYVERPEEYKKYRMNARIKAESFSIENTVKTLEALYED